MSKREHLAKIKQDVKAWNKWRKENPSFKPDLYYANLRGTDLSGADLSWADLSETKLSMANLTAANLTAANLIGADLSGADLSGADLTGAVIGAANLIDAILDKAILFRTNLYRADLSGADLSGSVFLNTIVSDVDLSVVKGLDKVIHISPSTIGIDTIYRSHGNIPEVFLRGTGVPDNFIKYMHSLTGQALQFYSCFISHSSKDKRICERLYADLQVKGIHTWYFPEDAKWGEPVWEEIDRSIKVYDKLIVVCSKNSLQSGPVLREIERALNREDKEHKSILFPVTIDNYICKTWKHPRKDDVLAKTVGFFNEWNRSDEKYKTAFMKLVKALNKDGKA
jgi:hypothetical protein